MTIPFKWLWDKLLEYLLWVVCYLWTQCVEVILGFMEWLEGHIDYEIDGADFEEYMDYFEMANTWFPLQEAFTFIAIYWTVCVVWSSFYRVLRLIPGIG